MVRVLLFARFRERHGAGSIAIPLENPAKVGDLRVALGRLWPDLTGLLAATGIAVNQNLASDDDPVGPDDEIALIPPVSGG
jgi:molybdopterin converting factor small subunit